AGASGSLRAPLSDAPLSDAPLSDAPLPDNSGADAAWLGVLGWADLVLVAALSSGLPPCLPSPLAAPLSPAATDGASAAEGAPPATVITATCWPLFTLSPSATLRLTILPAKGLGISMVALSPSRVIRVSPSATSSPSDTASTSTSTASAVHMSGMVTGL